MRGIVRKVARMTQEQVARAMNWSLSKVIRVEGGAAAISPNDAFKSISAERRRSGT